MMDSRDDDDVNNNIEKNHNDVYVSVSTNDETIETCLQGTKMSSPEEATVGNVGTNNKGHGANTNNDTLLRRSPRPVVPESAFSWTPAIPSASASSSSGTEAPAVRTAESSMIKCTASMMNGNNNIYGQPCSRDYNNDGKEEPEIDVSSTTGKHYSYYCFDEGSVESEEPEIDLSQPAPQDTLTASSSSSSTASSVAAPSSALSSPYSSPPIFLVVKANDNDNNENRATVPSPPKTTTSAFSRNKKNGKNARSSSLATSPGIRSRFQNQHRPPTKLHEICDKAESIHDLIQARSTLLQMKIPSREEILNFSTVRDNYGRTPMHIISNNIDIANDLVMIDNDSVDGSSNNNSKKNNNKQNKNNFFPDLVSNKQKRNGSLPNSTAETAAMLQTTISFEDNTDPARVLVAERFIIDFIFMANPMSCMSRDINGRIPFEEVLINWVKHYHDEMIHSQGIIRQQQQQQRNSMYMNKNNRDNFVVSQADAVVNALKSSVTKAAKKTSQILSSPPPPSPSDQQKQGHNGTTTPSKPTEARRCSLMKTPTATAVTANNNNNDTNNQQPNGYHVKGTPTPRNKCFPIHVQLSNQVSFALKMLSKIIERLEEMSSSALYHRAILPQQQVTRQQSRDSNNATTSPNSLQKVDSFDRVMQDASWKAGGKAASFTINSSYCHEISDAIIGSIASIPDFVKMILLIENDRARDYALSTTIVQKVLLNKQSVGGWLTAMLQNKERRVSGRAVSYLKKVSDITASEKPTNKDDGITGSSDLSRTERHRDDLHDEISRLQDFVPSLLALGEENMEEAATSMVVRRVMDRLISRPFAVTVIFCDAVFLALLIGGFRSAVNNLLVQGDDPTKVMNTVMRGIYIANTGIFYFIIRELGKAIGLCMITRKAKYYLWSFWNLTDFCSTFLALTSILCIRATSRSEEGLGIIDRHGLRDLLAVTTGFLWLRVLNLLKGINMQMATYILAILQITKDTLSFGVILLIMVIAFAQMFYTVLVPDFCSDEGQTKLDPDYQCEKTEYIFRVYTILLGDFQTFDRETFQTKFSIFLLVIYSFMVIIVLLNVLIALASDSYEKCLMKSQMLFGRARVMLIAELVCFQNLLRKTVDEDSNGLQNSTTTIGNSNHSNGSKSSDKWWTKGFARGWSRGSILFFGLSSMVVLFWVVGETAGYLSGERYGHTAISAASILINIALFASIMIFLSRGADSISLSASKRAAAANNGSRGCLVQTSSTDSSDSSLRLPSFLQNLMLRIMGSSQDTWNFIRSEKHSEENEWRGRVNHLSTRMDQMAKDTFDLSVKQTQLLEQMVASSEMRLKTEMEAVEQKVGDLKSDLLSEFQQAQTEMIKHIHLCVSSLQSP